MEMTEIKNMTDEELRVYLDDLRLTRKTGYDRKPRSESKRSNVPDNLKSVDNDLAALVLAELQKRSKGGT